MLPFQGLTVSSFFPITTKKKVSFLFTHASMATEYERKRLENIRRNGEMMGGSWFIICSSLAFLFYCIGKCGMLVVVLFLPPTRGFVRLSLCFPCSRDNFIGILSGPNLENTSMIYHNNNTDTFNSNFRGVWGWDDSYVFIGNLSKQIDAISTEQKRTVMSLRSPMMKAVPCRIYCHPLNVGVLAGSTAGGQVYVWKTK